MSTTVYRASWFHSVEWKIVRSYTTTEAAAHAYAESMRGAEYVNEITVERVEYPFDIDAEFVVAFKNGAYKPVVTPIGDCWMKPQQEE